MNNMLQKNIILIAITAILAASSASAQAVKNETRYLIVEDALQGFLSSLSYLNDREEAIMPVEIATTYTDKAGFNLTVNDKFLEVSLAEALTQYRDRVMLDFDTNHSIDEETVNISLEDRQRQLYRVSARVIRTRNCRDSIYGGETYTDELPMRFLVRYLPQSDRKVVITSIDCRIPDDSRRIVGYLSRYVFKMDNNLPDHLPVPYQGVRRIDDTDIKAMSLLETYAVYGDGRKELKKQENRDYHIYVDSLSSDEKGNKFLRIPYNESTKKRDIRLRYRQTDSGLEFYLTLEQEGRPRRSFFTCDDMGPRTLLAYHYGLEFPVGLSMMARLSKKSRIFLGGLVMGDMFLSGTWGENDREPKVVSTSVVNNYRVTQTQYDYLAVKYSSLMDPKGIAKTKYMGGEFLFNGGFMINNHLMAEVGLGAALSQEFHKMDTVQDLIVTTFTPLSDSQPAIDPVYNYTANHYDFSFAEKAVWSFAGRVGLRGGVFLGGTYSRTYLTGGVGFSFVPSVSRLNTFDFNIGVSYTIR